MQSDEKPEAEQRACPRSDNGGRSPEPSGLSTNFLVGFSFPSFYTFYFKNNKVQSMSSDY